MYFINHNTIHEENKKSMFITLRVPIQCLCRTLLKLDPRGPFRVMKPNLDIHRQYKEEKHLAYGITHILSFQIVSKHKYHN